MTRHTDHYDAVIVGSGPGGAMTAQVLVDAGARVLVLERGDWVPRGPKNHLPEAVAMLSPSYSTAVCMDADTDGGRRDAGAFHCVGGQSVYYGAVAFRYRERDFASAPEVVGGSGAAWPFGYDELEPWYARAERLLGVCGDEGADPTEPPRSGPYPARAAESTPAAAALHAAARRRGLSSFRPPMAIRLGGDAERRCSACGACDGFACARQAKGDAAEILAALVGRGLELRTRSVATRLLARGGAVRAVDVTDLRTGRRSRVTGEVVILAAGALATPQLLLASGLHRRNPGGQVVGRYLTRHCNAVVCGWFLRPPGAGFVPHKEFAVQDFYFGDPAHPELGGRIGNIQQTALPAALVEREAPALLRPLARHVLSHLMGLLVMTEDQPLAANHVSLDRSRTDEAGLPGLRIRHRHSARDRAARAVLIRAASGILREAGALITVSRPVESFTHALGTVRMGVDPATSALDGGGRFRGCANLYVADGSALPTAAAVNPALTIAANALRVADGIAGRRHWVDRTVRQERREVSHAFD